MADNYPSSQIHVRFRLFISVVLVGMAMAGSVLAAGRAMPELPNVEDSKTFDIQPDGSVLILGIGRFMLPVPVPSGGDSSSGTTPGGGTDDSSFPGGDDDGGGGDAAGSGSSLPGGTGIGSSIPGDDGSSAPGDDGSSSSSSSPGLGFPFLPGVSGGNFTFPGFPSFPPSGGGGTIPSIPGGKNPLSRGNNKGTDQVPAASSVTNNVPAAAAAAP
ncbi:hypothetical protein Dimus_009589 [Dionaea muscipula]